MFSGHISRPHSHKTLNASSDSLASSKNMACSKREQNNKIGLHQGILLNMYDLISLHNKHYKQNIWKIEY